MQDRQPNEGEGFDGEDSQQRQPRRKAVAPLEMTKKSAMFPDQQPPDDPQGDPSRRYYAPPPEKKKGMSPQNMAVFLSFFAIIASVAISFLMLGKFAPSITTVDVMAGQINNLDASINTANTGILPRLESVINGLTNYVRLSDLSGYAPMSALSGKADTTSLQTLSGQITGLQTDLATAQATINTLKDQIKVLQDAAVAPPPVTGTAGLSAKLQLQFGTSLIVPKNSTGEIQVPVRITVINNSTANLKDVRLAVAFLPQSAYFITLDYAAGYPTMASTLTQWAMVPGTTLSFQNGWGLNVNANSVTVIQATVVLKLNTPLTNDLVLVPDVGIMDSVA